jgi:hypothetical protein
LIPICKGFFEALLAALAAGAGCADAVADAPGVVVAVADPAGFADAAGRAETGAGRGVA